MRCRLFAALGLLTALVSQAACGQEEPGAPQKFDPPVRLKAGGEFIDTGKHVGHAGPLTADLDADGMPDLLVGNFAGHFQVYMNTGTRAEPVYADKGLLVAGGSTAKVPNW